MIVESANVMWFCSASTLYKRIDDQSVDTVITFAPELGINFYFRNTFV
jgi:hypothetical protein